MSSRHELRVVNSASSRCGRCLAVSGGIAFAALMVLWMSLSSGAAATPNRQQWHTLARASGVTVRGVTPALTGQANMVAAVLTSVRPHIERDVDVRLGRWAVDLYADHASFAAALRRQQGTSAQSDEDNTSAIVRGHLLLGPSSPGYVRHDLVHVYTEWALDRLTGNRRDALPANPWLYDGIAEYEAYRYVSSGLPCRANIPLPFSVIALRTPDQWLRMRGGPLVALEYCAAYLQARGLIEREGWIHVLETIHRYGWQKAGALLGRDTEEQRGRRDTRSGPAPSPE